MGRAADGHYVALSPALNIRKARESVQELAHYLVWRLDCIHQDNFPRKRKHGFYLKICDNYHSPIFQ